MNDPAPATPALSADAGEVRLTVTVTRKTGQVETYDIVGTLTPPEDTHHGSDPHHGGT